MTFHVKDGTPVQRPSLCETCSRAQITRGYLQSEMIVVCRATEPEFRVPFKVRECSNYNDRTRQSLYDMEQIAWVLQPRGPKRQAGFFSPNEGRDNEGEIELILNGNK